MAPRDQIEITFAAATAARVAKDALKAELLAANISPACSAEFRALDTAWDVALAAHDAAVRSYHRA